MPISNPTDISGLGYVNAGSFTGDGTTNRAIPHGLGVIPKFVALCVQDYWYLSFIIKGFAAIQSLGGSTAGPADMERDAVTAPEATNFYVGGASHIAQTMNINGKMIWWAAFG
ncbi:hypothetical protein ES705_33270 [subsurface metagenome]